MNQSLRCSAATVARALALRRNTERLLDRAAASVAQAHVNLTTASHVRTAAELARLLSRLQRAP